MTEDSLDYFKKYRELMEAHKEIYKKIDQEQVVMEALTKQRRAISNEIDAMQRIITYMIDNGIDPVEAKLKLEDDYNESLWRNNMRPDATISQSSMMQAQAGATGSSHWPSAPNGINGATGSIGLPITSYTKTGSIRG